jgi:hypothetical protein
MMMMMMSISPLCHKVVGDLSGISETYSHHPHSPLVETFWPSTWLMFAGVILTSSLREGKHLRLMIKIPIYGQKGVNLY